MTTIAELISRAERYCKSEGIALATLSTRIANDGKWLTNLKSGEAGCTIRRLKKVGDELSRLEALRDSEAA